jgi:Protein of unknown function (DUF4435)
MQKYLSRDDTIGEIRLSMKHPLGRFYVWVLVEGVTDQKLYAKLMDAETTKVQIAHGGGIRDLRYVMEVLVQESDRIIGIRDADFLHLDKQQESIDRLFVTDAHDAEMMMLSCDTVLQHLLAEHLPSESSKFKPLRENLLNSLAFLGGIRWLNHTENLMLNFTEVSLGAFYDAANWELNKTQCIQNIEARSSNKKRAVQEQEIDSKISAINDYYNLCNGHDAIKGFAMHLTEKSSNKKGINDKDLASALRMCYRKEDFIATKLYATLKNWETRMGCKL